MGSLMPGWSSPSKEKLQRNKSLIKDEIEAYWKAKKSLEVDQVDATSHAQNENQQNIHGVSENRLQRSISFPADDQHKSIINAKMRAGESGNSNCWWTRSNWAFLNEPLVRAMESDQLNATIHAQNENQNIHGGSENKMQRSISFPVDDQHKSIIDAKMRAGESGNSNCWWTQSNWAFLNEPPVKAMDGPPYKYAAQYHVADVGRAKSIANPDESC